MDDIEEHCQALRKQPEQLNRENKMIIICQPNISQHLTVKLFLRNMNHL